MTSQATTEDVIHLVKGWKRAQSELYDAERNVSRARTNLSNAQNEFIKRFMPKDAKVGEKISIWILDALIQFEVPQPYHDAIITVRQNGKEWDNI